MILTVLSPIGRPAVKDNPYDLTIPSAGFDGRLGVLANSQPGSHDFVESLGADLGRLLPGATVQYGDKGLSPAGSSMVMSEQEMSKVVADHDAVVLAYGHCGGCTSATIRDAVNIALRSVPVVALVVPRFVDQAKLVARSVGLSGVPIYVLPGPMTQLAVKGRADVAREVAPHVLELLAGRRA